jgi:hypothetical protein
VGSTAVENGSINSTPLLIYFSASFAQDSLGIKKFKKSYLREDQYFHFNIPCCVIKSKPNQAPRTLQITSPFLPADGG